MLNVPVLFHSAPVAAVKELPTAHSGQEDRASPPRAGSIKTFHALSPWPSISQLPAQAPVQQKLNDSFRGFVNACDKKPVLSIVDLAPDAADWRR